MPISLWKDTSRCLVQPSTIDSTSVVVEPNDPDSIIEFALGITNKINFFDNHNLYSLKKILPQNEQEAIDKLIILFIMAAITGSKYDQVRTSKIITFGWSEIPAREHEHFQGIPCNNSGAFYPRQNRGHYHSLHLHLFLDNLLPIMNENFNLVRTIFEQNFY